jgi:6-pyruvoyltetrahydropterin/6-carboxytetrahydropterin synthase
MLITKRVEFSASHVCRDPRLSDAGNMAVYGAEANPQGHGHNYILDVTLEGHPDSVTGMVMDLKELKDILTEDVLNCYDHRFLNYEVPPFDRVVPTPENIAIDIWNRLERRLAGPRAKLRQVRLYETADLYVDYFGSAA